MWFYTFNIQQISTIILNSELCCGYFQTWLCKKWPLHFSFFYIPLVCLDFISNFQDNLPNKTSYPEQTDGKTDTHTDRQTDRQTSVHNLELLDSANRPQKASLFAEFSLYMCSLNRTLTQLIPVTLRPSVSHNVPIISHMMPQVRELIG